MKLYEFIVTNKNSLEVLKDYRYFKSLKECRQYLESYGVEIVRIKRADDLKNKTLLKRAQDELIDREKR